MSTVLLRSSPSVNTTTAFLPCPDSTSLRARRTALYSAVPPHALSRSIFCARSSSGLPGGEMTNTELSKARTAFGHLGGSSWRNSFACPLTLGSARAMLPLVSIASATVTSACSAANPVTTCGASASKTLKSVRRNPGTNRPEPSFTVAVTWTALTPVESPRSMPLV